VAVTLASWSVEYVMVLAIKLELCFHEAPYGLCGIWDDVAAEGLFRNSIYLRKFSRLGVMTQVQRRTALDLEQCWRLSV